MMVNLRSCMPVLFLDELIRGTSMSQRAPWKLQDFATDRLQAPRGPKPLADTIDLRFTLIERRAARVDRVVAQDERVRMLDRRSQDERRVAIRLELDRVAGFLENGDLPREDRLVRPQGAFFDRQPCDRVSVGRRVAPALPVFQADVQIVDARGGTNWADGAAVTSEDHARRALRLHIVRGDVLAFRGTILLGGRQRHPKLEGAQRLAGQGPAVMPHAVSGPHPFEPSRRNGTALAGRV